MQGFLTGHGPWPTPGTPPPDETASIAAMAHRTMTLPALSARGSERRVRSSENFKSELCNAGVRNVPEGHRRGLMQVANDMSGFQPMLATGLLADFTITLENGHRFRTHKVVLAAASGMLRAKFESNLCDAATSVWTSDVGSQGAWTWILGWIYGSKDPLPDDLVIEIVVLADYLQMNHLVQAIKDVDMSHIEPELGIQLLKVWAIPSAVEHLLARCVPLLPINLRLLRELKEAPLENFVQVVRCLSLESEADRLQLVGWKLQRTPMGTFSDDLLSAIAWDAFPADVLQACWEGDASYFEQFLNQSITVTSAMKSAVVQAIFHRCRKHEERLQPQAIISRLDLPLPSRPGPGIFAKLLALGREPEVLLSSQHACNKGKEPTALCQLSTTEFGTGQQSPGSEPWIEVRTGPVGLKITGVGLKHGWRLFLDQCKTFSIEAAAADGVWHELLFCSDVPLSQAGGIFPVAECSSWFDRVRIRMRGPTSSDTWTLMVAWFEVFGTAATSVTSLLMEQEALF